MMMIKKSCELHATGHVYRGIPPNEQNDLSSGLLHSSSDDNSKNNQEQRAMLTAIATVRCVDHATASDDDGDSNSEMD